MMNYVFNDQFICVEKDEYGVEYIKLTYIVKGDMSDQEVELSFYPNSLVIPEKTVKAKHLGYDFEVPIKPENIVFNLKYNEYGGYLTTRTIKRKMTKEEIEKELGYKIEIKE